MEQTNILVLGAGGFIGTHLINKLNTIDNDLYSIQAVGANLSKFSELDNVKTLEGFIDNELLNKCECPDIIYHVAGGSSVAASVSDPCLDFNKTVLNINALLNKINTDWPQAKLIYVSSAAIYGRNASDNTSVETKRKPISPYGLHKKLVEELIAFYFDYFKINAVIIRPFSIYGPGLRKQLFWDALKKAELGDFNYFGTGDEKRDWIYIDDFINLLTTIYLDRTTKKSTFLEFINAGTGNGIKNSDILKKLLNIAGYSRLPNFIEKNKKGDPCDLVSSFNEQKESAEFYQTPIKIGLAKYVKWYEGLT